MTQVTTNLPNGGNTAHFAVSYDDGLSKAKGHDLAVDLMNFIENDLSLIINWFTGVNFHFSFPINVQITGNSGGASWTDPPDISLPFGYNPTVVLSPGSSPTTGLLRYLLVSEVTEMYMASQGNGWFESTNIFSGADEGSMGESLSRFLASKFLLLKGVSSAIFSGFTVVSNWLNAPPLQDWIDSAPDDIQPDSITGCGTCFLFFLHDQLGFSIQQIVAANGSSLAQVYQSLTGKSDAWQSFSKLVQDHYPPSSGPYSPPLDSIFPVGELSNFVVPGILSWVSNDPNIAVAVLNPVAPIPVSVLLTSDDPTLITLPAKLNITSSGIINLTVPKQSAAFTSKTVNLTASYAGKKIKLPVKVVQPEEIPLPPLVIKPGNAGDPCSKHFAATTSQDFYVTNANVIHDSSGLTYKWKVTGATAPVTNQPTLTIPTLPPAGTTVTVAVDIKNTYGIHATGSFDFVTTSAQYTVADMIREVQCRVSRVIDINKYVPPWVPIEVGDPVVVNEHLTALEDQAKRQVDAANGLIRSIEKVRVAMQSARAV